MADLATYTLKKDFSAPALNTGSSFAENKVFKAGQVVKGYLTSDTATGIKLVATVDGYAIPESAIEMPKPVVEAVEKAVGEVKKNTTLPKELQDKLNAIKSTDITSNIVKSARTSVNGLMAGAIVGLLFAMFKKKAILPSILVGAVGGGLAGYGYNKFTKKN